MMIKKLLMTAVAAAAMAGSANAASLVPLDGSVAAFAAPSGGVTTTFNGGSTGAGFSLSGLVNASIVNGSSVSNYQQPLFSDGSDYLAVKAGGTATLSTGLLGAGYQSVSIFLGSIDTYNTVQLLDTLGNVIATFTGTQLAFPSAADGGFAPGDSDTNRRLTFYRSNGDPLIGGIKFASSQNALEVDNVVFAVPEPATWMMMLGGFAFVGGAMRSRRRKQLNTVLA